MKKIITLTASLFLAANSFADIEWFVDANPMLGPDDINNQAETSFTTPLASSNFDAAAGYFVQLIYAGLDGVANPITGPGIMDPTGVTGDDQVVATRWSGAGLFTPNGEFQAGSPFAADVVGNYFVRAWAGFSPDSQDVFDTGSATARIPAAINGTHWWYGDSSVYSNPGDGPGVPAINSNDFSTPTPIVVNNLVQAIPEPSTFALLGIGGLLVVSRMRRK